MLSSNSYMRACVILTISVLLSASALCQTVVPTKGKEFWLGFMQNFIDNQSGEELQVFITSDQSTSGTLSIPQQGYSVNFNVAANTTTPLTLPNNIAEHYTSEVIESKGILIETQDTVSVFAINFNPNTADGTKVLPTKTLGTSYRVSSYPGIGSFHSELLVVATEDDTEIEITPSVATAGGNPAGVPFTVTLQRGESYQLKAGGSAEDLTGTQVKATEQSGACRPFAVFSGSSCAQVYETCTACDHLFEQNFPVKTWGTEFYSVPFTVSTDYKCTIRVLANQDNTNVNVNGTSVTLNSGEIYEVNDVQSVQCVTADKGISVTQYMQGLGCPGSNGVVGDPAMLILNDVNQKIDDITFSTVASANMDDHRMIVIAATEDIDQLTLDGAPVPSSSFALFPSCPSHSYADFTISEGSHTMSAPNGFSAYVYGFGAAETYAYSVGSFASRDLLNVELDSAFCDADSVLLDPEQNMFNTNWFMESNPEDTIFSGDQLLLTSPISPGVYIARGDVLVSGCVEEEFFLVETPESPSLEVTASDTVICENQSVQLSASLSPEGNNAYIYSWSNANTLNNPNVANPIATPTSSGWYVLEVSSFTGCTSTVTDSVFITVNPGGITDFRVNADRTIICEGEDIQFEADVEELIFEDNFDPGVSWGVWADIEDGMASSLCGSVGGNALYFNGNGDRFAETNDLNVQFGGTVSFWLKISSGVAPCDDADPGEDIILEYSVNGGAAWTPINTFAESAYPLFTQISANIPNGAFSTTTRFRWRQLSNSGNNEDNWMIDDVEISALHSNQFTYNWTDYNLDDNTISNPLATPQFDTTYVVEVFDPAFSCTYSDSISVQVGQQFTLQMTQDTSLCNGGMTELSAVPDVSGAFSYSWGPDDGSLNEIDSQTVEASPSATTTYSVDATSAYGCEATGETTVFLTDLVSTTASASSVEICAGDSIDLNASVVNGSSPLVFDWSNGGTSVSDMPATTVAPITDADFVFTATDTLSMCSVTDTISVLVYEEFSVAANNDTTVCDASGLPLSVVTDATENINWSWSPSGILDDPSSDSPQVTANQSAQFVVTGANDFGCAKTDTVQVNVAFYEFDLGPDLVMCPGDTIVLNSGAEAASYNWSTGSTADSTLVTSPGIVTFNATSAEGCTVSDQVEITAEPSPNVSLQSPAVLCEGDTVLLDAENSGSTYNWSDDSHGQTLTVNQSGEYWVEVTNAAGCVETDTVLLDFSANPVVGLEDEVTICNGDFLTLDAGGDGVDYDWNSSHQTQSITVGDSGVYVVEVTNADDCATFDSTIVSVVPYPEVDLGSQLTLCEGEEVTLDAGNPGLTHEWSTGEDTQTITVTESGNYLVIVSNEACEVIEDVSVGVFPLPESNLRSSVKYCFGMEEDPLVLDAGDGGATYAWRNGEDDQQITVFAPGYYEVTITTAFGCQATFSSEVEENCSSHMLYIPNAFTPDGDGLNDVFRVYGEGVVEYKMLIFDRWGTLVFESEDMNQAWRGEVRGGEKYPEHEVFTYRVIYKYEEEDLSISDPVEKTGNITLIR
ncbi:T9SS type B sorting domain-containing protein [Halocola ammonii]